VGNFLSIAMCEIPKALVLDLHAALIMGLQTSMSGINGMDLDGTAPTTRGMIMILVGISIGRNI
jgi:hypothetical protein